MTETKKGKIYKIITHLGDDIYIGSTSKERLSMRFASHCYDYRRYNKGDLRKRISSFDIFDRYNIENCKIILIEEIEFTNKKELREREQYWIDNTECINKRSAFIEDPKTYKKEWGRMHLEEKRQYYHNNKETIQLKIKSYRNANKELFAEQQKTYAEKHREEIASYKKDYAEKHREEIASYKRQYYLRKKAEKKQEAPLSSPD